MKMEVWLIIILNPQWKEFSSIFKKQTYYPECKYKFSPYIKPLEITDGLILYNLLSFEMIFLNLNEIDLYNDSSSELYRKLVEKWFYISSDVSSSSMLYLLRQKRLSEYNSTITDKIVHATILTTTECNARCPYCYEYGCQKNTMSLETCKNTIEYLKKNCDNVTLRWFGGEPLVNATAINYICAELQNCHIPYHSNMISNGYLLDRFDDDTIVNLWKLKRLQITIDGTQHEYLKIKRLPIDSYTKVIGQVIRCAKLNIRVNVRIHLTLQNAEDIRLLLNELADKLRCLGDKRKNVYLYLMPLFVGLGNVDTTLTEEQDVELAKTYMELDKLRNSLQKTHRKIAYPKANHCMADSKNQVVITPTGKLTLCEHCSDREFIGDVVNGIQTIPSKWYKPKDKQSECDTCFFAPLCNRLEMCEVESYCTKGNRMIKAYEVKNLMWQYYSRWKQSEFERKNRIILSDISTLISNANQEIGNRNYEKYSKEVFDTINHDPWCITWICWLFLKTFGIEKALDYLCLNNFTSDVIQFLESFKNNKRFSRNTIQPGYIIFLRMNRQWTNHAELVIDVTDTSIITIGGNCGGKVQKNEYARDDERISGFGIINYE